MWWIFFLILVLCERNVAEIFEYTFYLKIFKNFSKIWMLLLLSKKDMYVYCGILEVGISGLAGCYFLLSSSLDCDEG